MCGEKSEPHRGKSAEVFVFFILSRERENKTKSRRRCCPSSPAHGKDEDAGDPEGAAAARQSGFPCQDTNGSNNKRQL